MSGTGTGTGTRTAPREADPWWGDEKPVRRAVVAAATTPVRRRRPLAVRILRYPFVHAAVLVRRSPRLRRILTRVVITLTALSIIGGAVGVILLNNTVIRRTAELGELDDRRRELRRDNAVLAATGARLSAPPRIVQRATVELGMAQATEMPKYIYLDGCSRTLTPQQRRRVSARAAKFRGAVC